MTRSVPLLRVSATLRRWAAAAFVLLVAPTLARTAHAQDMDVPVALQMPLFLKVLSFDRQLSARVGPELVVGIVYQSGYRTSTNAKNDAVRALNDVRTTPDGRAVRAVAIDIDRESLTDAVARTRLTMLYVAPLRGYDLANVCAAARTAQATTVTGVARYATQGLAVSVRLEGDRPRLLVNVDAAKSEGAEFSAELLKLAKIVQ
jgi:hypothetical protein